MIVGIQEKKHKVMRKEDGKKFDGIPFLTTGTKILDC